MGAIAALALIVEVSSYLINLRASRKAESLLRDVREMLVGTTTREEVNRIANRYGGGAVGHHNGSVPCESFIPRWEPYRIEIESTVLNRIGLLDRLHDTRFRIFGATQWKVYASFGIDEAGRLSCVEYSVYSDPLDRDSLRLRANESLPYSAADHDTYGVGGRNVHYVQLLVASVTTRATTEQRQRAFDLELRCLAHIGGCRAACEVMPSAWLDYQRQALQEGFALPRDELDDPRCKRL